MLFSFKEKLNNYKIGDFLFKDGEIIPGKTPAKIPGCNFIDTTIPYLLTCYKTGDKTGQLNLIIAVK